MMAPAAVREGVYRGLAAAVAAGAVLPCLWGRGRASLWLGLAFVPFLVRLTVDRHYRSAWLDWLGGLWESASRFAQRGDLLPWHAALVLVVIPSGLLFLSTNRTVGWGDSWPVLPTACSLLRQGDVELGEFLDAVPPSYRLPDGERLPYCVLRTDSGHYSSYPSGMVQFALPVALAARLVGADLDSPRVHSRLEKWAAAWLAALSLGLFFLLALHLGDPLAAAVTTAFLAAGSAMFSTVGQALWQHGGVIFWALAALLCEFRAHRRPTTATAVLTGVACAMMLSCRLSAGLFVVPLGLWVLLRSPRRGLVVGVAAAAAYAPWAILYGSIYGTPFGPSTGQMDAGNWLGPNADGLLGVLFSPARGLFVYQPWLLLLVVLLLPWCRRREGSRVPAGWQWLCLAVIAAQVLLVGSWKVWWGGHCWGSRLLAEVVPLGALLCVGPVAMLLKLRAGRAVLVALALVAFALHAAGMYSERGWVHCAEVDRDARMLWSWSRAPFLTPWQRGP